MSLEQEDGEIVDQTDLDAIRLLSPPNNSTSKIIELRPLVSRRKPTIEETLREAVSQYMAQAPKKPGEVSVYSSVNCREWQLRSYRLSP